MMFLLILNLILLMCFRVAIIREHVTKEEKLLESMEGGAGRSRLENLEVIKVTQNCPHDDGSGGNFDLFFTMIGRFLKALCIPQNLLKSKILLGSFKLTPTEMGCTFLFSEKICFA